jgi:hypothetical protein
MNLYIFLKFSHNNIWGNFNLNHMSHYFSPWGVFRDDGQDILIYYCSLDYMSWWNNKIPWFYSLFVPLGFEGFVWYIFNYNYSLDFFRRVFHGGFNNITKGWSNGAGIDQGGVLRTFWYDLIPKGADIYIYIYIWEDLLSPVLDALPCVVATHEVWCSHVFDGNITPAAAQPMADTIAVQFVFSFACSSIMQGMAASRRWQDWCMPWHRSRPKWLLQRTPTECMQKNKQKHSGMCYSLRPKINTILGLSTQINERCKITILPLVFCEKDLNIWLSFVWETSRLLIFCG